MRRGCYIIAEAGVNHNGSLELARDLIAVAADAGADAVKFQTFKAENLVTLEAQKAAYQEAAMSDGGGQLEMLKRLEMDGAMHHDLIEFAKVKGIQFLSTAFDLESLSTLNEFGLPMFKIPSGEITNYQLLKAVARLGKPVVLSTGMADLGEIEEAIEVLLTFG
ncbi:N-acetylneuraminate synthase family protein, partial [bacterium]|nr:N-acetylneuraminate synthase family protein [bacterium]